jgi:hypothetical protein
MGIRQPSRIPAGEPMFPDIDVNLEMMLRRMIGLVFIEISAFHVFAWAEAVLSDADLVAGDGEAARIVRCIRADETPHVEYLRTALTEMRDRTFVDGRGRKVPGTKIVGELWDFLLGESLGVRREQAVATAMNELEYALEGNPRHDEIVEQFHALATPAAA